MSLKNDLQFLKELKKIVIKIKEAKDNIIIQYEREDSTLEERGGSYMKESDARDELYMFCKSYFKEIDQLF